MSEPGLRCLVAWSPSRPLDGIIADSLMARVPAADLSRPWPGVCLLYTKAAPDAIRDWLRPLLRDDESLLVTAFETWSSRGPGVDTAWLLRRGH